MFAKVSLAAAALAATVAMAAPAASAAPRHDRGAAPIDRLYEAERAEYDEARSPRRFRHRFGWGRVFAHGEAGPGPRFVVRRRAERAAIQNWVDKVADRRGYNFASWVRAEDKRVHCFGERHVECIVSARPRHRSGGYLSRVLD